VVETLHLGVEGGVGERRTEPGPGKGNKAFHTHEDGNVVHVHDHQHENQGVEGQTTTKTEEEGRARIKVGFEETMNGDNDESSVVRIEGNGEKKPVMRKKVGWATVQHDKPELYDF
jgi:hypothetical protein